MSLEEGFRNILIVDDEENVRHMIEAQLNQAGFRAVSAQNGKVALETIKQEHFDLILSDIRMPEMDGLQLLAEARKIPSPPIVIMMSAYGDKQTAIEAVTAGAYDYISKPFDREDLLLTIRKAEEREKLLHDNKKLKKELYSKFSIDGIIGRSEALKKILAAVEKIAPYKTSVLISGQSGTGKELIARALHSGSPRADKAFVAINCGAIPENLLESELFGFARGSFTGASADKPGLFEKASGGTLFLDEIGELPLPLQVKLLRVLQEEEVQRIGENAPRKVDARIVAATIKNMESEVEAGLFREDLFFRLKVFDIEMPPLSKRKEDIPYLVDHFISKYNLRFGKSLERAEPAALKLLVNHEWRGNIRELENVIERAVIMADEVALRAEDLPENLRADVDPDSAEFEPGEGDLSIKKATKRLERDYIIRALKKKDGNKTHAARELEISHRALLYKIKEYKIK